MVNQTSILTGVSNSVGNAFGSIFSSIKLLVTWLLILFFIGLFIYITIYIFIRIKKNANLEDDLKDIIRKGKINKDKMKLRNLFTSNNTGKLINEGKIISYVEVEEEKKNERKLGGERFSIFAVRKGFENLFFKVNKNKHSKLGGDIILDDWNFVIDEQSKFMIINKNKLTINSAKYETEKIGVDTLSKFSPIIQNCILANPFHRIRVRERKLIKLPEENKAEFPNPFR